MLSINTNISSLIAQQSMSSATNKLNQAIERMTTGYKINSAKDNAANYSISTNMTTKINSYMVAEDNVAMGLDMLSTANGSLDQISDKLTRLRALATQASNGTYGQQSLTAINSEANALVDEINRIYSTAEYNGKKIFSGDEVSEAQAVGYGLARAGGTKKFINDVVQRDTSGMTKLSTVDESQNLASGTYSISTVEELEKLARLVNTGKLFDADNNVAYGTYEFVLANDIDLAGYGNWTPIGGYLDSNGNMGYFTGTFDGNGYSIKNMEMVDMPFTDGDSEGNMYFGLFGTAYNATIKNLGVENVNIKNIRPYYTAPLISYGVSTKVTNCFSSGTIDSSGSVGGLVGYLASDTVGEILLSDSYSVATVSLSYSAESDMQIGGGLTAYIMVDDVGNEPISNCFFAGEVSGEFDPDNGKNFWPATAAFQGAEFIDTCITEEIIQKWSDLISAGGGDPSLYWSKMKTKEELQTKYGIDIEAVKAGSGSGGGLSGSNYVTLQVGINADSYSQIGLEFGFALDGIEGLRQIGLDTSTDYLSTLDNMLDVVSAKATEYGAAQNRLESALDEIAIQYDNLVSSRSTLRDADIAEVSSLYIQQQILQQASATLLATANQSPSIALQLI